MNVITRLAQPDCWTAKKKIDFYSNLRDRNNEIRPRWLNTYLDIDRNKKPRIRTTLLEMSDSCCAYCGRKIKLEEMDVEHFLPKEAFPYLAYCWENYLASCKPCNQYIKRDFVPESFKKRLLKDINIDKFIPKNAVQETLKANLSTQLADYEYFDKSVILENCQDRIIDPSFDNPNEHLKFDVLSGYEGLTDIGKITKSLFFEENFADDLANISKSIFDLINGGHAAPWEYIQEHFISRFGYEFYYRAYYAYWKPFFNKEINKPNG
jgi:uncharacterized protein (TIGR02646 family)